MQWLQARLCMVVLCPSQNLTCQVDSSNCLVSMQSVLHDTVSNTMKDPWVSLNMTCQRTVLVLQQLAVLRQPVPHMCQSLLQHCSSMQHLDRPAGDHPR